MKNNKQLLKYIITTVLLIATTNIANAEKVAKITHDIKVRQEETSLSYNIEKLKKDEIVTVLNENNGWIKIKTNNNNIGYVSNYYLKDLYKQDDKTDQEDNKKEKKKDTQKLPTNTTNSKLDEYVNRQTTVLNTSYNNGTWGKATPEEIKEAVDPNSKRNKTSRYQFARIDHYKNNLKGDDVDRYLENYINPNNIFYKKGEAFVNAAKKANIDTAYLVAHSMVESGYGTSTLAKGNEYLDKTVYNLFGIGAIDSDPLEGGKKMAYDNDWSSIDKAIEGSADWISRFYIHSNKYKQNTLYKMRWHKDVIHQYASDINWAKLIGDKMQQILSFATKKYKYTFDIPKY